MPPTININYKPFLSRIIFVCSMGLILFLYTPLLQIIADGLRPSNLIHILTTASYYNIFLFTLFQAIISMLSSLLVGFSVAYIVSNYNFVGKTFIKTLSLIPFIVPSIIVVLGFVIVWGNNGIINNLLDGLVDKIAPLLAPFLAPLVAPLVAIPHTTPILPLLYSFPAIIIAHTFYNFGICAHIISAGWETLPESHIKAAENLGASRFQIYRNIIIPHLLPSIKTSCVIVFLFCFTSFAIVLILGGGPWYSTIEIIIYKLIRIDFDIHKASSLALIQMLITFSISLIFLKSRGRQIKANAKRILPLLSRAKYKHPIRIYIWVLYTLVLMPFIAIIIVSLFEKNSRAGIPHLSIMPYIALLKNPYVYKAIINSINISIVSTSIAFLLAITISISLYAHNNTRLNTFVSPLVNIVLFLPYFISPIVLSLAYISFRTFVGHQSFLLLIIVHALLSLPFLMRIMTTALQHIRINTIYAAKNLGANHFQLFTSMYIPLITPSLIIAFSLSLCLSLGELSAALILIPSKQSTIPLVLYEFLGRYRFLDATRMGVILIAIAFLALISVSLMGSLMGNIMGNTRNTTGNTTGNTIKKYNGNKIPKKDLFC